MSSARGDSLSQFVETLVQRAESWRTAPLPGRWKPLAGPPGPSRKEAQTAEPVFGTVAQRIVATEEAGKLTRLDVLFMERGAAAADDAYMQAMRQAASRASAGVQSKVGKPGQILKSAAGAAPGTVVQEWSGGVATIRLTLEPGSRLYLSMIAPQTPAAIASTATSSAAAKTKQAPLKSRLEEKANGDVILTGLPDLPRVDDNSNYTLRAAECLAGYYGWTMDVRAVATSSGWSPKASLDTTYDVMEALARAAKVDWTACLIDDLRKKDQTLDLMEARRWIDKGRPIVYRHMYSELRERFLFDFAKQYEQNPKLELPGPKDPAEKSKWLRWEGNAKFYGITAVIFGYNKKRGEFIIKYPGYTPGNQIIRMREEELAASLLRVYYISPD
ncbi:MAG: hypothetical protein B7Z37_05935 [Verrucomicrobia bacterium 12-59-8]|nr:MAG: hypothetical protein B7Z37_05935 [Verrucomicrobia bacterium 12-59-8]